MATLTKIIDKEDYRLQKGKLLSEKKSLEEEIYNLSHKQNDWLEPFQNWLEVAQNIDKIASDSDLFAKKVCAKNLWLEPPPWRKTGARQRLKILNSFGKMGKSVGRASRVPPSGFEKAVEFCIGAPKRNRTSISPLGRDCSIH